jgi:tetratricopeptide (TPR) repeat protein
MQRFRILLALIKYRHKTSWVKAFEAAQAISQDWERAPALIELAETLAQAGQPRSALKVLEAALTCSSVISNSGNRSKELRKVALLFAEWGELDRAQDIARMIDGMDDRIYALARITSRLIETGHSSDAARLVRECSEESRRGDSFISTHTYIALAEALVAAGERDMSDRVLDEAYVAALQYPDWEDRRGMQLTVVEAYTRCGFVEKAEGIAVSDDALRVLIETLVDLGQGRRALPVLDRMRAGEERDQAAARAVSGLIREGDWTEARRRASDINKPFWRATAYMEFLTLDAEEGIRDVTAIIDSILNSDSRAYAYRLLASSLNKSGMNTKAAELYGQALLAAGDSGHSTGEVARMMAADGFSAEAIEAAGRIEDPFARGHALRNVSFVLAGRGDRSEATAAYEGSLAAFEENEDRWERGERAKTLRKLGGWLSRRGFHTAAKKIFEVSAACAEGIQGDESHRAVELGKLFDAMAASGYDDVMAQVAERMREDHYGSRWEYSLKSAVIVSRNRGRSAAEPLFRRAEGHLDTLDERERPEATVHFCRALLDAGFDEWVTHVLNKSWEMLGDNNSVVESRATLIGWLIKALGEHGRVDEAVRLGSTTTDEYPLAELVICLAKSGRLSEADEVLKSIDDYWHDRACQSVAEILTESGKDQEAEVFISRIGEEPARAAAWLATVASRMRGRRLEAGLAAARQVLSLIESMDTGARRPWAAKLALAVSECGDPVAVEEFADVALSCHPDANRLDSRQEEAEERLLGDLLMSQGKFIQSLTEYGDSDAAGLLRRAIRNSARLDAVEDGLAIRVLIALVQVLAWNSDEWQKVHAFLTQ